MISLNLNTKDIMISHKHKFIFVHVSKTAGTTIRQALNGMYDELHDPHHSGISVIKNKLSDEIFQTYFKFGTVRNPWDREVSLYNYLRQHNPRNPNTEWYYNGFERFIKQRKADTEQTSDPKKGRLGYHQIMIDGEIGLDFIIKFENLQEDFDIACDKIGIPKRKLPHTNKSKHKHYTEYYNDETREIVAKHYAQEIEYFRYEY